MNIVKYWRISYYIKINLPKNIHSKIHDNKAIINAKNVCKGVKNNMFKIGIRYHSKCPSVFLSVCPSVTLSGKQDFLGGYLRYSSHFFVQIHLLYEYLFCRYMLYIIKTEYLLYNLLYRLYNNYCFSSFKKLHYLWRYSSIHSCLYSPTQKLFFYFSPRSR